jgi:lysozyme family protein
MSNFYDAIDVIIHHEALQRPDGSWFFWIDDPADPGGETAWGISMLIIKREGMTAESLGLKDLSPGSLKNLKLEKAEELYKLFFWDRYKYEKIIDQNNATKVFDASVNCGPLRGAAMLQRAANHCGHKLDDDGILGPISLKAINECDQKKLIIEMAQEMRDYYMDLVVRKPLLKKFLKGWLMRADWIG